jgi:hypothetical protein
LKNSELKKDKSITELFFDVFIVLFAINGLSDELIVVNVKADLILLLIFRFIEFVDI